MRTSIAIALAILSSPATASPVTIDDLHPFHIGFELPGEQCCAPDNDLAFINLTFAPSDVLDPGEALTVYLDQGATGQHWQMMGFREPSDSVSAVWHGPAAWSQWALLAQQGFSIETPSGTSVALLSASFGYARSNSSFSVDSRSWADAPPVPIPPSAALFASGLAGLFFLGRRKRSKGGNDKCTVQF